MAAIALTIALALGWGEPSIESPPTAPSPQSSLVFEPIRDLHLFETREKVEASIVPTTGVSARRSYTVLWCELIVSLV